MYISMTSSLKWSYMYLYICVYTWLSIIYIMLYIYICTHLFLFMYIYTNMYIFTYNVWGVCVCVCICIYILSFRIFTLVWFHSSQWFLDSFSLLHLAAVSSSSNNHCIDIFIIYHSPIVGHLDYLPFLAIVNKTVMNIYVQVFV